MKLITVALVAAFAVAAAQAQQAPAPSGGSVQQACSGEMKSLCPGQTGQAATKCLANAAKSNPNSVSASCKSALQSAPRR